MNYKKYIKTYNIKINIENSINDLKNDYKNNLINKSDYINYYTLLINEYNNHNRLLLNYEYFNKKAKKIRIKN